MEEDTQGIHKFFSIMMIYNHFRCLHPELPIIHPSGKIISMEFLKIIEEDEAGMLSDLMNLIKSGRQKFEFSPITEGKIQEVYTAIQEYIERKNSHG